MAFIDIKDLSFSYPDAKKAALDRVSFSVSEGEFVLIAGASGCGKSTLLRRLKPALCAYGNVSGGVFFCGEPIEALDFRRHSAEIGFVMQDPEMQLVTDKVFHELAFGLESLGTDQRSMRVRVAEMANFFGIQNLFNLPVSQLSGGQKQLVCLASVMVMKPKLLLLDEPTSQLDPIAAADFFDTLRRINDELGTTIIITEHRIENLFPMVDKFIFMQDGTVRYAGSPREIVPFVNKEPSLFNVLPTAMNVFARTCGFSPSAPPPLTVREGRSYLASRLSSHVEFSAEASAPVRTKGEKPLLSMRDAWFRYEKNGADILKGASLDVYAGELLCLIGGNGAGKTTAIMTASGMYKPYRGKILLDGKPIGRYSETELYKKRIGVLLQNPILSFVHDSVREELEGVIKSFHLTKEKLDEVVELMELGDILSSNPYDISGGELQRAAIAKLLVHEPELIFLDEATKGMDAFFKEKFGRLLKKLAERGTAIVLVSHDIEFCAEYATRLAMFFDGGVIAQGTPRSVLSGNTFYTTAAGRISSGIAEGVITANELVEIIDKSIRSAKE